MRLGLIGTGKQGQRYLQEKNGGRHIVVSGSRRIPLDSVDGVIVATHPAGHKELALEAIAAGKAVLIEKPLALNLRDCMDIIDAAEKAGVRLEVAHTHLWSDRWSRKPSDGNIIVDVRWSEHERDYSVWLDWGPHVLAMAASLLPDAGPAELNAAVCLSRWKERRIFVAAVMRDRSHFIYTGESNRFPMGRMTDALCGGYDVTPYDFNRRVYRALFAED